MWINFISTKILEITLLNGWTVYDVLEYIFCQKGNIIMQFIFVKTRDFREMEIQILRTIKYIKLHTLKTIFYSFRF